METQKFYDFNNGLFCVHFPNNLGLSIEEITSIFSEFGDVVTVAKSGDDYGFRFVKYRNEDEVIRCVQGLRNHQSIRLRVRGPNFQKNRNQTNNNNVANSSHGQKDYRRNGQRNESNNNTICQSFSNLSADKTTSDNKEQCVNNNNSTTPQPEHKYCSPLHQRIIAARRDTQNTFIHDNVVQKLNEVQEPHSDSSKSAKSLPRPAVASETLTPTHAKICEDNVNSSPMASYGVSSGVQKTDTEVFCSDAQSSHPTTESKDTRPLAKLDDAAKNIPISVMKNSVDNAESNKGETINPCPAGVDIPKIKIAEQVIVANIHTDFGVNHIVHLFRKYDPLSVSEMKIVPSLGLRFCIVYLQSLHQAYAIEREFDKVNLSGKNLLVLRLDRLAELAA